jgi:AAA+ superfamily predicted ATPase
VVLSLARGELSGEAVKRGLGEMPQGAYRQPPAPQPGLLEALRRLDGLLERAIAAAEVAYGAEAAVDPYRGLHISHDDVERMLAREPCESPLRLSVDERPESSLVWMTQAFGLSEFDSDVLLVALAPELDLRYERLYAYLQDDVSLRRPTVDLVLNLLCANAGEKLAARTRFAPDAPLVEKRLLSLIPDPNRPELPLLSHFLKVDDQIVAVLLGDHGLDPQLASFCRHVEPSTNLDELLVAPPVKRSLRGLSRKRVETDEPLTLYFRGPAGVGKRRAAEALAREAGASLLFADLTLVREQGREFECAVHRVLREAWLQGSILYLEGSDGLRREDPPARLELVLEALASSRCTTIIGGAEAWIPAGREPLGAVTLEFPLPAFAERWTCWHDELEAVDVSLPESDLDALAGRFRLTPVQISDAVATAVQRARSPKLNDLFATARSQSGQELAKLARKIEAVYTWADIVLPEDTVRHLRELCLRPTHRHLVMNQWGFDRKLSLGKGTTALFAGSSGTGKTMAAEVIAHELALDLYKIDLSGVVSKYIGETEKNLDRIFDAAESSNAILFFDEADALFGKRSEVRDSHDRYANIEISYLLQKMEEYEGVAILATNLRQNLDDAFTRRLTFSIHFPLPDEESRERIWRGVWTAETPLADDVDVGVLAHRFRLSGGNIRNIALGAAFLAAESRDAVRMTHVLRAARREYEKMGTLLSEDEGCIRAASAEKANR